jgi:hypothetical protein
VIKIVKKVLKLAIKRQVPGPKGNIKKIRIRI